MNKLNINLVCVGHTIQRKFDKKFFALWGDGKPLWSTEPIVLPEDVAPIYFEQIKKFEGSNNVAFCPVYVDVVG